MAGGNLPNAVKGVSAGVGDNPLLTPFYVDVLTTLSLDNSNLQISDDAKNWQICGSRTLNKGRYYFRGNQTTGKVTIGITSQNQYNVGGNIMSLISYTWDEATLYNACFYETFKNAKVVDVSALLLPATTLVERCYFQMFWGCTSLTKAPKLPATTLAQSCYNDMFAGCTSLTTAPALSAMTLVQNCYNGMFQNCTSLTTAPELPAMTLAERCYYQMFKNCTKLNYIKCLATDISAIECTLEWVKNVAANGTFVKKRGVSYASGNNGIPTGWTVEEID